MIGQKTLAAGLLLAIGLALAVSAGLFAPETWQALTPRALFVLTLFAVLVGTLVYRFWRLDVPSERYLRAGQGERLWEDEAPFVSVGSFVIVTGRSRGSRGDVPRRVLHAVYVGLAFLLGVGTLDARALERLRAAPSHLAMASGEFCPDANAPLVAEDTEVAGCALVRRAFELGYAKDLGDCAPKARQATASVCTLRQRDEPALHYAGRQLASAWNLAAPKLMGVKDIAWREQYEHERQRLPALFAAQRTVVQAAPRSSHHLFTNLPKPKSGLLEVANCLDRYRSLPHRPDDGQPSEVLEHVVAKLVFETRYAPAAGHCPEYTIHWDTPADICAQLAREPDGALAAQGALLPIVGALERSRLGQRAPTHGTGDATQSIVRGIAPERFVSLQCYVVDQGQAVRHRTHGVKVLGLALDAHEVRVPEPPTDRDRLFVATYANVAELFSMSFTYGGLLSAAGLDASPSLDTIFEPRDFRLTRLELLRGVDVFRERHWPVAHATVLEVYPYGLHLANFVQVFRTHYRLERGRL